MIQVNHVAIEDDAVLSEMQYHDAETHGDCKNKAAEALIIAELIKQRALDLNIELDIVNPQEAALNALLDRDISMPEATSQDCKNYYQQNPEKFMSSPLVSVRHILLAAKPDDANARSEALDKAKVIIERLQGNAEAFASFAAEFSTCPSKKMGGQLGQISKGQTAPEFERQLFRCEEGLVSAPIESRYGVHVVLVEQKVEGNVLPYALVHERIAEYLNEKVRRKAIAQYIGQLVSQAEIKGFDIESSDSPLMQ